MLYIIPSPIGNLKDFSYRAVELLPTLDYLLCEDTRKTKLLLIRYYPDTYKNIKILSYYKDNEFEKLPKVIEFLNLGLNIGLLTDAGTPSISDPGFRLVRECRKLNLQVIALPGPSASITALTASGLPTDRFCFVGYLPKKNAQLITFLKAFDKNNYWGTIIAYESPYRLLDTLKALKLVFGDIQIVIAREITKLYETYYCGKISEVEGSLPNTIKGEITLLFNLYEIN